MNVRGVVAELDATGVQHTIVLAMDEESVEVIVTLAHRNLQDVGQIFDGAISVHHSPSSDHWVDTNEIAGVDG